MNSRREAQVLSVHLFGSMVGTLTWLPTQQIVFAFSQEYLLDKSRPTLSLCYRDVITGIRTKIKPTSVRLPPFFSNLLPEGKLRTYLARRANVNESHEFFLLAELCEDLPGAVRLRTDRLLSVPDKQIDIDGPLRFSLSGVQLKLSGDMTNHKVTIPVAGAGGHWIVKLPAPALPRINELEYSMLKIAKAVGIDVPDIELVPIGEVEGIPADLPETMIGDCLLSRRFDRTGSHERIHSEDFCQVYGLNDKYDPQYNYQSIASVLWTEIGIQAVHEFIRRLVFSVAIGNADMHLKNWSLIYPNRRDPQLSPAYDFIPSAPIYPNTYQKLALKLAGENRFEYIGIDNFRKLAALAKLPERSVLSVANETASAIFYEWSILQNDLPLTAGEKRLITEHLDRSPFMHERQPLVLNKAQEKSIQAHTLQTSTGVVLSGNMKLDPTVPPHKIVFEAADGKRFEVEAPRRMVTVFLMERLQKLLRDHPELNMQTFQAHAAPSLYYEWREENIPKIESRHLSDPITEEDLQRDTLSVAGTFFTITFQMLQNMHRLHQFGDLDFVLDNGRLWTANGQVRNIFDVSSLEDGRKFARIDLFLQNPHADTTP